MRASDIETLRSILKDTKIWISVGKILKLEPAEDKSYIAALVNLLPYNTEVVSKLTWDHTGVNSGIYAPPAVNDMVLVAINEENESFIIRHLTSKEELLPQAVLDGHTSIRSIAGKKVYLGSDTKILLAKGNTDPTEPVMLGNVMKTLLSYVLGEISKLSDEVSKHKHVGNLGAPTSVPDNAAQFITLKTNFDNKKASPVDDNAINSDLSFTEK